MLSVDHEVNTYTMINASWLKEPRVSFSWTIMKGYYLYKSDIKLAQMLKDYYFCSFKMAESQVLEV